MCDQLTSCALRISEPFAVKCANISSHSATWQELKLELPDSPGWVSSPWREIEWPQGSVQPVIRWRDADDANHRARVIEWVLAEWPTCESFVRYCCDHATSATVWDNAALTSLSLPVATSATVRGNTALTSLSLPVATSATVWDNAALTSLSLPVATSATVWDNAALTSLSLPVATSANVRGNAALTSLSLPVATSATVWGNTALTSLSLPVATSATVRDNAANLTIKRVSNETKSQT